ncbi:MULTISPECIES: hypothetical protein [unclassified Caulobacter]|uniref:hypothetical protein n=1 Tax=unclassified Caulobacter TaxID=2648921 RepID=UPI0018CBFCF7|nr:hypothetical protein [Caulobacter sp. UNC358MFTsu5.1]
MATVTGVGALLPFRTIRDPVTTTSSTVAFEASLASLLASCAKAWVEIAATLTPRKSIFVIENVFISNPYFLFYLFCHRIRPQKLVVNRISEEFILIFPRLNPTITDVRGRPSA